MNPYIKKQYQQEQNNMKKYVLTEAQVKRVIDRLIDEEAQLSGVKGKVYGCDRNSTISACYKKSGFKGTPKFKMTDGVGLFSMLYLVAPGDTWNGILNNVLQIDGFYGIGDKDLERKREALKNYEYWSKNVLNMNSLLNGKKEGIKAGDILHLEGPYD